MLRILNMPCHVNIGIIISIHQIRQIAVRQYLEGPMAEHCIVKARNYPHDVVGKTYIALFALLAASSKRLYND